MAYPPDPVETRGTGGNTPNEPFKVTVESVRPITKPPRLLMWRMRLRTWWFKKRHPEAYAAVLTMQAEVERRIFFGDGDA